MYINIFQKSPDVTKITTICVVHKLSGNMSSMTTDELYIYIYIVHEWSSMTCFH